MKFGYGLLTAQNPPDGNRSYQQIYDETVRLATHAEAVGFDSVWTSEHHFWEDGYTPSVLPLCAALATATDEVTIGTGVALAPLYDPIRFAEDAATVDQLSNGRFLPCVANGYMPHEFEAFGVQIEERPGRVEELIAICRRAWTGAPFSYQGEFHQYADIRVTPPPVQADGPPLVLGGTSVPALGRAARIADGHIGFVPAGGSGTGGHGYSLDAEVEAVTRKTLVRKFIEDIEFVADRSDQPAAELAFVSLDSGFVAETDQVAWETVRDPLLYAGRQYARHYRGEPVSTDRGPEALELLRQNSLVGAPNTVIDRLQEYERLAPEWLEPHVIALGPHPGLGYETNVEALDLFGEAVIPAFS